MTIWAGRCSAATSRSGSATRTRATPLGEVMQRLAAEIEEDRETLLELMEALDVARNPVKQVTGWVAEKASRVKFSGATSGEPEYGTFMAIESLRLGVAGKRCLWIALREVRDDYPELAEPGPRSADRARVVAGERARAPARRHRRRGARPRLRSAAQRAGVPRR